MAKLIITGKVRELEKFEKRPQKESTYEMPLIEVDGDFDAKAFDREWTPANIGELARRLSGNHRAIRTLKKRQKRQKKSEE
jgi:hypothetical protein